MASKVLFNSVCYDHIDAESTLPAKFGRLLKALDLSPLKGKNVAIKMHVGRGIGYTTIHPLFVKMLVDELKGVGAKPFCTDQTIEGAKIRGYTEEVLGCPVVDVCGHLGKYYYEKYVNLRTFKNVDVAGHIHDADAMIDLSHVKGHGACGYGGACKNIAMGCVTDRTRGQIHGVQGGLVWEADKCIHCGACIEGCNHNANRFNDKNEYDVNYELCTNCGHCTLVCPVEAVHRDDDRYHDFQRAMALCTKTVLDTFEPGMVYYINFLTNMTMLCDCWGFSGPNILPDIGICASQDICAIERACLDMMKLENLIPAGLPRGYELGKEGHLLERIHFKNPFIQIDELQKRGLGTQDYELVTIE